MNSVQSKWPAGSSTSGTATNPLRHNQSSGTAAPPHEWQRCSEGFQLTDRDQDSEPHTQLPSKLGQRHRKGCALLSVKSVEQITTETVTNSERNFGQKWIQPEDLFPAFGSQKSGNGICASDLRFEGSATSTCQTKGKHTCTCIERHIHPHMCTHIHTYTHTHVCMHPPHTHTHTLTLTHMCAHTHS